MIGRRGLRADTCGDRTSLTESGSSFGKADRVSVRGVVTNG